jgi:signal transduction histidine kinase
MNSLQRARLSTRRLWMALIVATAVLVAVHAAGSYAIAERLDREQLALDAGFAVVLLIIAGWALARLRRDRERAAVEGLLLGLLSTPRNIKDTATEALRVLADNGIGDAAVVAIVGEGDGPMHPTAATGYPRGWLDSAPTASLGAVGAAPRWHRPKQPSLWVEPVARRLGGRPWTAEIPLRSGTDTIGLLIVSLRRPGILAHAGLRELIATHLGAAFDHAALYEAAYRRERDLEDLETRRRDFMASLSHEIRTPLTSIQAFADLLRLDQGSMDDTAREMVASLSGGVDRLSALVNDLIDLGRTSSVELAAEPRDVDLATILRDAEATLRPSVMLRGQTFVLDIPPGALRAHVDPRLLEQVILNLLSNATRYTPPGGVIGLSAFPLDDTTVRIEVCDSGPGIPPEERERIFEPYYRVRETERAVPGSGLGLAVARRLMDLCGGRIWAEASDTGGARFCVDIRTSA